jgi:antitoxin ParD1/3/4
MHVSLTPTLDEFVRRKVESGLYNNASEVVREALRLLRDHEELRRVKLERLRAEVGKGEADFAAGRYKVFETDEELAAFFERL